MSRCLTYLFPESAHIFHKEVSLNKSLNPLEALPLLKTMGNLAKSIP